MAGLNIQRLRDILDKVYDAGNGVLRTSGSGGSSTVPLAIFKAIANGTGYSTNDIIILRQISPNPPEYYNATTATVIATPNPSDLGSVNSSSNVSITTALPAGTNAIGAITNSSFGISGFLPAFASTPTVNIGTVPNLTFTNTSFTANAGVNLNTSLLALESGGNLAGINAKLPSGLTVISNRLSVDGSGVTQPVSLAAPVTQKSNAFQSSATLTRAANTTTYAANDVIFGAFELQNIGNNGGFIFLTDIHFLMNITYLPSGIGNLRLFLYNVTPPSAVADNGAFSVPSGDRASILTPAGISLGTPARANGGGSLVLALPNINRLYKLSGTSLFGYLVTEGTWVPTANSETATITAMAIEA
jgi:hypothetical protein